MRLLPFLLVAFSCLPIQAQQVVDLSTSSSGDFINAPVNDETREARKDRFQGALNKAIRSAVKKGELTRVKAVRLRVALLAPSFRKHCEDLAVIQMAFSSQSDVLPYDETGKIERANIDWDQFIEFLEKLIPLVLKLIDLFGA